jgi:6-phosphogluconolactonase (cycloisomerase 2 family)
MKKSVIVSTAAGMMALAAACSEAPKTEVVIGTYGEHLYTYSFNHQTLEFTETANAKAWNASYALAEEGCIFAVSEVGSESGAYSFVHQKDQGIELTAEHRQTGADPCFVMIYEDPDTGKYMMTADYSGGSVSVFPIEDGRIGERVEQICFEGSGPVSARQEASHIHQLKEVPGAQGYILASDLGADVIRLLKAGKCEGTTVNPGALKLEHIKDIPCPAGSGPRHMEFSADGKRLYCIAELSGEVLVYGAGSDGEPSFTLVQRIQADEVNAGGSADIHIHPSGKWIYTSHRLDNDGISIFKINEDGTLEKCGYARTGRHPRNFMITPDGELLLVACRDDRLIQVFTIEKDGTLTLTPSKLVFESDMPSSITAVL